MFLLPL